MLHIAVSKLLYYVRTRILAGFYNAGLHDRQLATGNSKENDGFALKEQIKHMKR